MSQEPTEALDEFRRRFSADSNVWWRVECGDHLNLFEEACDLLDAYRSLAGDLWNELEHLHQAWEGTDRAPLIEGYIDRYEFLSSGEAA